MNRIVIGIAAMSLLATGAMAADLAPGTNVPRPYVKAPPMVDPGYDWTGFYAGLNGGYSWGRSNATVVPTTPFTVGIGQNVDGGLGGGQIGYNWQVDPKWVLGVEADLQATGERGRSIDALTALRIGSIGVTGTASSSTDFPWFATFRGRAGVLADPSLLLYATGGLAVGEVKFGTQATLTAQLFDGGNAPVGAPVTRTGAAVSESQTRLGWTAGVGIEKKFNRNWSAKLEYLYLDLGSATYFGGTANETAVKFHDHILRAGFNYQFAPGPVVARY
ncbi:outer membrane protein [Bradyrhizobium sp. RDM4]|uniref:outer membrane protein n=1 Tax=Bradyrhizobium sp. RDM4 TaxID=3378765 RepID=UPI0038FD2859